MGILLISVDDEGVAVIKRQGRQMDRCSELGCCLWRLCACTRLEQGMTEYAFKDPDAAYTHMMMQVKYIEFCKPRLPAWMFASRVGENL